MRLKIKRAGNGVDGLLKNLKKSKGVGVAVGHFEDQSHYSGYNMSDLMTLHMFGAKVGDSTRSDRIPPRPILDITEFKILRDLRVFQPIKEVLSGSFSPTEVKTAMLKVGTNIKQTEKSVFGGSALTPNHYLTVSSKGSGKGPMVDKGDLMNSIEVRPLWG